MNCQVEASAAGSTGMQRPTSPWVHRMFEELVARQPDATAIVEGGLTLTYRQLDDHATRWALELGRQGVCAGDYVALIMRRSADMIIAQLAVLKAGAAYVSIDPATPATRQQFLLEDCEARVSIQCKSAGGVADFDLQVARGGQPTERSAQDAPLVLGAYLMYTSGSTGTPKGVVIPHSAIVGLVTNTNYVDVDESDSIVHGSNPAFDASTFEVWAALLNGARVCVFDTATMLDPSSFAEAVERHRCSILFLTTALFNRYARIAPHVFSCMKCVIVGGEEADPWAFDRVLQHGGPRNLLNGYGPTETTTFATCLRVTRSESVSRLTIGRPISGARVYLLDEAGSPVDAGLEGEICIGGSGVALGYLKRPMLTADRFIPDPWGARGGERMYRTGDRGRWTLDGNLEFLGRKDAQVKVRGFRIELSEIEATLLRHPAVSEAVVLLRERTQGDKQLVGYVVFHRASAALADIGAFLAERLPIYMVPELVEIEMLPLTGNGKVDKRKLLDIEHGSSSANESRMLDGSIEAELQNIWSAVLGVREFKMTDDFTQLGGHSLNALDVVAAISDRFSVNMPSSLVMRYPTVRQMSALIQLVQAGPMSQEGGDSSWDRGVL